MVSEGFVGADVDGLRQLSGRVRTHSENVERISRQANSEIQRLLQIWVGAGAEEFRQVWFNQHSPALRHAAALLDEAASTLKDNADRQEVTSDQLDGSEFGLPLIPNLPGVGPLLRALRNAGEGSRKVLDNLIETAKNAEALPIDGSASEQRAFWNNLTESRRDSLLEHTPERVLQMEHLSPDIHAQARQSLFGQGLQFQQTKTIHNSYEFGEVEDQYRDGARAFEFDLQPSERSNDFQVSHWQEDKRSEVSGFRDALSDIDDLNATEPTFAFIDVKNRDLTQAPNHYVKETPDFYTSDLFDRIARDELGSEKLFTPSDYVDWAQELDSSITTVDDARSKVGWPPEDVIGGRTMLVLTDHTDGYEGTAAFVASKFSPTETPTSPIVNVNENDITAAQIEKLQSDGYLVRTYPDGSQKLFGNQRLRWDHTQAPDKGANFRAVDPH